MVSPPRKLKNFPAKRSTPSFYKRSRPHRRKSSTTPSSFSSVPDKLEALKNLLPVHDTGAAAAATIGSADQLFQETADYILFLRTKVSILQKLVDFYGSSSPSDLIVQQ